MFVVIEVSGHRESVRINVNQICSVSYNPKNKWFPYEVRMSNGDVWHTTSDNVNKIVL